MMKLLPTWGWGVFAVLGALTGLVYVMLGLSIWEDSCSTQRQYCPKNADHHFEHMP